jgi:hypothetical protein
MAGDEMMRAIPGRPRLSARLARTLGLDGNPLRRASDRAEAWIRVGLLTLFLIAGPVAAQAAAGWVHQAGTPGPGAGAGSAHPVRAVLLQPAAALHAGAAPLSGAPALVRARWEDPGGTARTGEVLAPRGSPAGSVVTVWVDAAGRVTAPPPEPGQPGNETVLAVIIALAAVAVALLALLRLSQRFLNWRRLAAWEAAWSVTAPRWTGHRP